MKDEHDLAEFGDHVIITEEFRRAWKTLPPQKKRVVREKVKLLIMNTRYPSLQAHRVLRSGGRIWECYINSALRLFYQYRKGKLWLHGLGGHKMIDRY